LSRGLAPIAALPAEAWAQRQPQRRACCGSGRRRSRRRDRREAAKGGLFVIFLGLWLLLLLNDRLGFICRYRWGRIVRFR
jgi:hypothetical protein